MSDSIIKNLTHLPLFKGVDPSEVIRLTKDLPEKFYKKGEHIIHQGDRGLEAHLLLSGKVEVFYTSPTGDRATIIYHQAPFIFGEVELWGEHPYLASIQAMEDCTTRLLSKRDYIQLLHSNHQACINMVRLLSELLWQTGEDRRVRIFGGVDHLLANVLCYFAHLYGEKRDEGILIRQDINKKQLADSIGVARQSIIRSFDNLLKDGLIVVKEKRILIPDLNSLKKKAHQQQ